MAVGRLPQDLADTLVARVDPTQDIVSKALGDVEDSFFTFSPPALRNQKPAINANEMFVQLLGAYIVAPRCVLPIGAACKDDSTAKGDSTSKAGGRKKPSRKLADFADDAHFDYDPLSHEAAIASGEFQQRALMTRGGVMPVARRGRRLASPEEEESEADPCIEATAPLYSTEVQFIRWETTIIVCT